MTAMIMPTKQLFSPRSHQRGAALFTALIFLVIVTMIGLTAMRSGTMELKMAGNTAAMADNFERTQSLIDAAIMTPGEIPVKDDPVGHRYCTVTPAFGVACDADTISLPAGLYATDLAGSPPKAIVQATRLAPLYGPAPRGTGTSAALFAAAQFDVQGDYDRSADNQGRLRINQGLVALVPKP